MSDLRFLRERTGLHHTQDENHYYHARHRKDCWTLDVYDDLDGHIDPRTRQHFECSDFQEIRRIAADIHKELTA